MCDFLLIANSNRGYFTVHEQSQLDYSSLQRPIETKKAGAL